MGIEIGKDKAHGGWLTDWNRKAAFLEPFFACRAFGSLRDPGQVTSAPVCLLCTCVVGSPSMGNCHVSSPQIHFTCTSSMQGSVWGLVCSFIFIERLGFDLARLIVYKGSRFTRRTMRLDHMRIIETVLESGFGS